MKNYLKQIITVFLFSVLTAQAETNDTLCSPTSYHCLDPQGVAFAVVGPIRMWYNRLEQGCVASPVSHVDGCVQITQVCNNLYPQRCNNDCLAGNAASYVLERSCVGVIPISPATSVPTIIHDVYFQNGNRDFVPVERQYYQYP